MNSPDFLYPATPVNVPSSVTEPSPAFKKEVSGVMGSILVFFFVYLAMFALSIGLVIGCVYAGIAIIINIPRFITIAVGLGLIGLGIMVFVFLIKFMFAVSRFDRSGSIEVTEAEQPRLFAFIRQLTKDTQTPFPKKIYFSPDVNACVFYDSSFWSMFFPVRKNLQIGLGLVNSINVSEFKAVMAHEFGHFSQRSMKLGSFVYNVNRIIYNMLFHNNSYGEFLRSWASIGNIFAIFASLTARIAQGIQWVLRQMYGVINKSYMRLSREMEFHADAVAASVTGSKSLVTALRRIEIADNGYNIVLQKCNDLFHEKKISPNIYRDQRVVLKFMAEEFKLPVEHDLPVVSNEFVQSNNHSRVNFKDQWASHPSTIDREQHLNALPVEAEIVSESAWVLFDNKEQLQLRLTQKVYEQAITGQEVKEIEADEFEKKFQEESKRFTIPALYKGFYDSRDVTLMQPDEIDAVPTGFSEKIDDLFSELHVMLPKKIKAITGDIEVLKAIDAKRIDSKSFDLDGIKHDREEAAAMAIKLEEEQKQQQQELELLDKQVIYFFLHKAEQKDLREAADLRNLYKVYFEKRKQADDFLKRINTMLEALGPIYGGHTLPVEQIRGMINDLKTINEPIFKRQLGIWMEIGIAGQQEIDKKNIEKYIASDYVYFSGSVFFEAELAELNKVCNTSWRLVAHFVFEKWRTILEKQAALIS